MTHARPMFPPHADRRNPADREGFSDNCSVSAQFSEPKNCADRDQFSGRSEAVPPEALEAASQPVYVQTDISPDDLFKALGRLRREAAAEIERLIAFLDEIGPDADLEPSGDELDADADDEPSLASPEAHPDGGLGCLWWNRRRRDRDGSQARWGTQGNRDDREGDDGFDDREGDELIHGGESEREDDEDSGEHEPSLGSFDRLMDQDHAWRQTEGNARTWPAHCNGDYETDAAQ